MEGTKRRLAIMALFEDVEVHERAQTSPRLSLPAAFQFSLFRVDRLPRKHFYHYPVNQYIIIPDNYIVIYAYS